MLKKKKKKPSALVIHHLDCFWTSELKLLQYLLSSSFSVSKNNRQHTQKTACILCMENLLDKVLLR